MSADGQPHGVKIMVIDDSPDNIAVLQAILTRDGFTVISLMNSAAPFSDVLREMPALVLCDVCMPGFDGPLLTRMLKSVDVTAKIPVLLCSSLDESELARRAADSGADGYVRKTASPREIIARVHRALERARGRV